jgi:hypothetical protein
MNEYDKESRAPPRQHRDSKQATIKHLDRLVGGWFKVKGMSVPHNNKLEGDAPTASCMCVMYKVLYNGTIYQYYM